MNWGSWSEFFAMGGYALYVWGSMSVVFAMMLGEVVYLIYQGKSIRKQLANANAANSRKSRRNK